MATIKEQLDLQIEEARLTGAYPINTGFIKLPFGYALMWDDVMPGYYWLNFVGHINCDNQFDKWATYHHAVAHSRHGRFNFKTQQVEWNVPQIGGDR